MNITSLIKITTSTALIAAAALSASCIQPQPQQQAAQDQQQLGVNPYAVPGLDAQAQNPNYDSQNVAPYQPLPGVPSDSPSNYTPEPTPSYEPTPQPSSTATTHDVIAGESLWRISRKYGITVEALQAANGLKNDNIWAGQKLNIPAAN